MPHTWTHAGAVRLADGDRYRLERCQACGATRKTTITPPPVGHPNCEKLPKPAKFLVLAMPGQPTASGR